MLNRNFLFANVEEKNPDQHKNSLACKGLKVLKCSTVVLIVSARGLEAATILDQLKKEIVYLTGKYLDW